MSWIRSTKLLFMFIVLLAFIFLSWIFYEAYFLRSLPVTSWTEDARGDCALALTGGHGRIRAGFDLLQRGDVRKLIISGVNPKVTVDDVFPQIDMYPGVQRFNVIIENNSRTTYGNVVHSLPLLRNLRCHKVILVTSELHMPRAKRLFEKYSKDLEFEVHSVYSDQRAQDIFYEAAKTVFYNLWF